MIAVILAGGRARRFHGVVKPMLEVEQRKIVDRQCEILLSVCDRIVISAQTPVSWTALPVVLDEFADGGPLAGIHAGLGAATDWALVVAGDMPYLRADVLRLLLNAVPADVKAVAFSIDGRPQPLCALYHRDCRARLGERITVGQCKVADFLLDPTTNTHFIEETSLRQTDPMLRNFHNVNSPADLSL
jgi:molybdenum cofactor guanylyltransferase